MKKMMLAVSAILLMASCKVNYDKTETGLAYKIFPSKEGAKLDPGKYVKVNIEFSIPEYHDTILNTTWGKIPGFMKIDTTQGAEYSFMEILPKCKVGDSAIIVLSIDTLVKRKAIEKFDSVFSSNRNIVCKMKVLAAYNSEADVKADYDKELEIERQREIKSAEDYVTKQGWKNVQKTKSGAFVYIENPGDINNKVDSGKTASIRYKGSLQKTGLEFDSNTDPKKDTTLLEVSVGGGGRPMIAGIEEGISYFGKGGKGKIIIPAFLGYGEMPSGPIPAFSNLVFDVDVVDVKPTIFSKPPVMPVPGK
ncbi:MAG: FKBP-type peptidyl-prolyl cis-trans isomerase [Bacteroidetes bacterium]|nr:FKBP-type peptidyl-prolyl cis-trans isomerase [Bacteroidota bacterium]